MAGMGSGQYLRQGYGPRSRPRGWHNQGIAIGVAEADMVPAGQTALHSGQHSGGGELRPGSVKESTGGVEQHCGRAGTAIRKVAHGLDDRVVDMVCID